MVESAVGSGVPLLRNDVADALASGQIDDADLELLTEKKRPLNEVRNYTLLREAQKELGIR